LTTTKANHQCPDCDHAPYPTAKGLATHRRFAHGYVGTGRSSVAKRKQHQKAINGRDLSTWPNRTKGKFPCPECDFVASWVGGLKNHIARKHKPKRTDTKRSQLAKITEAIPVSQNGHHPHADEAQIAASDRALEVALAITLGRFTEICRSMATQYDIPERMFAARFAELVYRTQIRQPHRGSVSMPSL
jgi:C2H2-type zinc-finger domain